MTFLLLIKQSLQSEVAKMLVWPLSEMTAEPRERVSCKAFVETDVTESEG